jgi:hypothetical protein
MQSFPYASYEETEGWASSKVVAMSVGFFQFSFLKNICILYLLRGAI